MASRGATLVSRARRQARTASRHATVRSGVVRRLDIPTAGGRRYELDVDLQRDFALNQPLSAFALAALATSAVRGLNSYAINGGPCAAKA